MASDGEDSQQRVAAALSKTPPRRRHASEDLSSSDDESMVDVMAAARQKELKAAVDQALRGGGPAPTQLGLLADPLSMSQLSWQSNLLSQLSQTQARFSPPPAQLLQTQVGQVVNNQQKKRAPAPAAAPPRKAARVNQPLPPELAAFRYEHRDRLKIQEELDAKSKTDQGPFRVATLIVTGSDVRGNKKEWVLNSLRSEQLRELAGNLGCRKLGSASKFECRKAIARRIDMGEMYSNLNVANPVTSSEDLKVNTLMRIINAAFLPENFQQLVVLNDKQKRKQFEAASGGNPISAFWRNTLELVNDPEQNNRLGVVYFASEHDDMHLHLMVTEQKVNLNDFTPGAFKTCHKHFNDMMKARQNIVNSKKISGQHQPDTWGYLNPKHLQKGMPGGPVYCLDKMCAEHPEMDSAHAIFLKEGLKSDSTKPPTNGDDENTAKKPKDMFLETMAEASKRMEEIQTDAKEHREQLIALQQEDMNVNKTRGLWDDYVSLYKSIKSMASSSQIRINLCSRLKVIEEALGIENEASVLRENENN